MTPGATIMTSRPENVGQSQHDWGTFSHDSVFCDSWSATGPEGYQVPSGLRPDRDRARGYHVPDGERLMRVSNHRKSLGCLGKICSSTAVRTAHQSRCDDRRLAQAEKGNRCRDAGRDGTASRTREALPARYESRGRGRLRELCAAIHHLFLRARLAGACLPAGSQGGPWRRRETSPGGPLFARDR